MPLTKERKEQLVDEYVELLDQSKAIIFTEYRGLSNVDMTKVRRSVREANGTYRVTKLTLLRLAMEKAGYAIPEDVFNVPVAVGFCLDEVPAVAKALTDFAEDNDAITVRGGVMEDAFLSEAQIEALAELPPLDVLQAQILGLLEAPAANLVGVIQAGVGQVVNVLDAYIGQGESA